jgi:hypothetical protein
MGFDSLTGDYFDRGPVHTIKHWIRWKGPRKPVAAQCFAKSNSAPLSQDVFAKPPIEHVRRRLMFWRVTAGDNVAVLPRAPAEKTAAPCISRIVVAPAL